MIDRQDSTHQASHFVAATLLWFWLSLYQANAQFRETAFGQVHWVAVPGSYDRFGLSNSPPSGTLAWFYSSQTSMLATAILDSSEGLLGWKHHHVSPPADQFIVVETAPDQKRLGVGIDRSRRILSLYSHLEPDSLRPQSSLSVPVAPGGFVFGDLNNDKRTDILVYDRETPGVIPLFNTGNERFKEGKLFAPDNAVGALALVHLNNDNVIDIVMYDWVKSEVHLLYGIGQGKFLDQAAFPVDGEVRQLAATTVTRGSAPNIVLSCTNPSRIETLVGDGIGNFKQGYRIELKEPLLTMLLADVNGDSATDIVGLDGASMVRVFVNAGDDTFDDRLDFAGGAGITQIALHGGQVPGVQDAFLLDREEQRLTQLVHASARGVLVDSLTYASGARPRGTVIADLNGDGMNDILLVTAGSNSFSIYLNSRTLGLMGPTSYALPSSPHDIAFHSRKDSAARILLSYPEAKQISLFSLDLNDGSATNASVSTERGMELLYWEDDRQPAIDFFCFGPPVAATPASLTLFREIEGHQFIERSFRLSSSNALLGAGIGRLNNDFFPDVAFVYRNGTTGKHQLAITLGDSLYAFKQRTDLLELPQKALARSYVWLVDVDQDGRQDIVMLNDGPPTVLEYVRHLRETFYTPLDTIALGVRLADWSQLQFCDLNGDGNMDIVLNDMSKGQLGWCQGRGTSFSPYKVLWSVPSSSHFSIGDLDNDGILDLAVTFGEQGIVRVYNGKLLLREGQ